MTFNELIAQAEDYFKKTHQISPEWLKKALEAAHNGASAEEIASIPDEVDYNVDCCNGCDIINAFNAGYWAARQELGLPKCD